MVSFNIVIATKNGKDPKRCQSYRCVHFTEVSVKKELTVVGSSQCNALNVTVNLKTPFKQK